MDIAGFRLGFPKASINAGTSSSVKAVDGDGNGIVTVKEVVEALHAVGIEFDKKPFSESVVSNFGGKDGQYTFDEFKNLIEKNPIVLKRDTGLKIVFGNTSYIVTKDGKLKEAPVVVPIKEEKQSDAAPAPQVVAPAAVPKEEKIVVPFNLLDNLVDKHLDRFKELTGITNDDVAKDCLKDILSDKEASIDTINNVLEKKLKIGWRFNSFSFSAFGVDNKTKARLSGDAFLSNLEATILDLNNGSNAPSKLKEYAEGINFSFINTDSKFAKANVSIFRESARSLLNKYKINDSKGIPINENTELSETIKALLTANPPSITDSDSAKLEFLRKIAAESAGELAKGNFIEYDQTSKKITDISGKSEINKAYEDQIGTNISNKIYNKIPELITWTEGLAGMSQQSMFSGLYENANNKETVYKERLQEFFDKSGNVFDMKGLRPGLWYVFENMFGGNQKLMVNKEIKGVVIPEILQTKAGGEIK